MASLALGNIATSAIVRTATISIGRFRSIVFLWGGWHGRMIVTMTNTTKSRKRKSEKSAPATPPSAPEENEGNVGGATLSATVRDRITGLQRIRAGDLIPHPMNWRRHPQRQQDALTAMLQDVGWAGVATAFRHPDHPDKFMLIDGHLRAGLDPELEVPTIVLDVDPDEAKKLLLTIDPLSALAETDGAILAQLTSSIDIDNAHVLSVLDELRAKATVEAPIVGAVDPDNIPDPPDEPTTRLGDIWIMDVGVGGVGGMNHRLMCGSSALAADVDRLLDGQKIHLVNTDPPYNVKVEPRSNNAVAAGNTSYPGAKKKTHHQSFDEARHGVRKPTGQMRAKDRPLANDFISDAAFEQLLLDWFGIIAASLVPGGAFYIWGGYANLSNYPPAMYACDLYFSQAIVWIKEHPVMTRKDFMGNHEWCFYGYVPIDVNPASPSADHQIRYAEATRVVQHDFAPGHRPAFYGWKLGGAHKWYGPRNIPDVWIVKKVTPQKMIHLTEKPVELARRAISYSSKPGDNVFDLFGGSGSTMIGAHDLKRRAFLMELDPAYCDVICERFRQYSGGVEPRLAVLDDAGRSVPGPTWSEVRAQRGTDRSTAASGPLTPETRGG